MRKEEREQREEMRVYMRARKLACGGLPLSAFVWMGVDEMGYRLWEMSSSLVHQNVDDDRYTRYRAIKA